MKIIVAPHAGFCFGVEKAVKTVYDEIAGGGHICTYGPIIHNEIVVKDMEERGVRVLREDIPDEADVKDTTVVLRSHGVSRATEESIAAKGARIVDATCPFVKRIHKIVREAGEAGREVLVIGDHAHPEVQAITGWTAGKVTVLKDAEEARRFTTNPQAEITLVSQTTYNHKKFQELVEILQQKDYNIHVVNTICNATEVRQTEAEEIAASVDAMIVIGDRHSSNTRKLFEICKEKCAYTYFIQTLDDLHLELPKAVKLVGITAGASTPKKIIEEVQHYVRTNF